MGSPRCRVVASNMSRDDHVLLNENQQQVTSALNLNRPFWYKMAGSLAQSPVSPPLSFHLNPQLLSYIFSSFSWVIHPVIVGLLLKKMRWVRATAVAAQCVVY